MSRYYPRGADGQYLRYPPDEDRWRYPNGERRSHHLKLWCHMPERNAHGRIRRVMWRAKMIEVDKHFDRVWTEKKSGTM